MGRPWLVTPTLAQATEAVLRGALEPALDIYKEDYRMSFAGQASPRKAARGMCIEYQMELLSRAVQFCLQQ